MWHKTRIARRDLRSYVTHAGTDGRVTTVFRAMPVFRCETKDFTRRRVGMPSAAIFDRYTSDSGIVSHGPRSREQSANETSPTSSGNFPRAVISPSTPHGRRSFCPPSHLSPPLFPLPRHFFFPPLTKRLNLI